MREERAEGLHRIDVRDKKGHVSKAILEIKYRRIRVLPPVNKKRRYPELTLTVIPAQERGTPQGREKIDWKVDHGLAGEFQSGMGIGDEKRGERPIPLRHKVARSFTLSSRSSDIHRLY
jgi:hypothetical protein